ncbi:hypothetical protein AFEL58S_02080 [Afipia felis]
MPSGRPYTTMVGDDREQDRHTPYIRADIVNDLLAALETAIRVAEEARQEWDAGPSGMKAGKLLIALSDPTLKYRSDITTMHAALAKAKGDAS